MQHRLLQHHRTLAYQPGILLYHNRWLAPRENEPLQHGYTTGMIATYLYLGLRGDRYAWNYFKYRFGTVTQEVASRPEPGAARKPRRFYAERAAAFAKELLGGAWLALTPVGDPAALARREQDDEHGERDDDECGPGPRSSHGRDGK